MFECCTVKDKWPILYGTFVLCLCTKQYIKQKSQLWSPGAKPRDNQQRTQATRTQADRGTVHPSTIVKFDGCNVPQSAHGVSDERQRGKLLTLTAATHILGNIAEEERFRCLKKLASIMREVDVSRSLNGKF
jgi:hypothetical protein